MQNNNTIYRFERKFFVQNGDPAAVEKMILHHPAFFSEVFHERYINNIYFDTIELSNFMDNINGNMHRQKYRIRWYSDLFSKVEKPVLELKIKKGLVGTKRLHKLNQFEIYKNIGVANIKNVIGESELEADVKFSMQMQNPVLLNRYKRKYYISKDKKFRVTIDTDQSFYKFNHFNNSFLQSFKDDTNIIIELKYDSEHEKESEMITNQLPYRLTKSSKYARGIELLYY
jgi:hypothetical protein